MKGLQLAIVALIVVVAAPCALALSPQDQRISYRAQVRLSDLPEGWRTEKTDTSNNKKCFDPEKIAKPTAKSRRDFAKGAVADLFGEVILYRTATLTQRVRSRRG